MISVVMPTKGRPAQAVACVKRLFETTRGHDVECVVVIEGSDLETLGALDALGKLPVVIHRTAYGIGPIPSWNEGMAVARGEWIVTGADDLLWCEGWLEAALSTASALSTAALAAAQGAGTAPLRMRGFCGLYDGHTRPEERATHMLMSRAYIEEAQHGYLMPPWYKSWYPDAEICAVAKRNGAYVCPVEARVEHFHPDWATAPDDPTYQAGRKYHAEDRRTFYRRQRFGFPNEAVAWGEDVRPVIGVPIERCIPYADETFWAFMALAQQGWPFIKLPYTRTDVARNKFALHVLNSDFTHLIMLDIDHDHPADVVRRLVRCVERDRSRMVVSGLNFRRGQPYDPIAFVVKDDPQGDSATYAVADWEPGDLLSVDVIGCGCVIVAREVFEKLSGPPWFWNDYRGAALDNWPGEDITFSRLCRSHGIELLIDTGTSSDHMIDGRVNEAVYRAYIGAHRDEVYAEEG